MIRLGEVLRRLYLEDDGQDLVEYALLASIVGVTSMLAYTTIPGKMGTAYSNWGSNVYDLWEPDAPMP
jgi:Flp pilus assembly pilin Flp